MPGTTPEQAGRVVVGKITAPYGIKGWVRIHSYTEPDTNILDYRGLQMQRGEGWEPVEIDAGRRHGKGIVAHIAGCNDRDQAVLLAQRELLVSAEQLPELADEEYYWRQLEGLSVYTRVDGDWLLLGQINHLFTTGANDVMVVEASEGSVDRRQRLIPWVPERHVLDVDLAAGKVRVDWDPDF